jgi:molybdate transport system substrate-binding protein
MICKKIIFLGALILLCHLPQATAKQPTITIACASNFVTTLEEILQSYQSAHPIKHIIIQGSSGKLSMALAHGLPADLFLSADKQHTDHLIKQNLTEKAFVYAIGEVLFLTEEEKPYPSVAAYLNDAQHTTLTIANPLLAPYGKKAKGLLQKMHLWAKFKNQIIYGENISQSFLYVASRNVNAGFVARSQWLEFKTLHPQKARLLHAYRLKATSNYLLQYGLILNQAKDKKAISDFVTYLLTAKKAQQIMRHRGYQSLNPIKKKI